MDLDYIESLKSEKESELILSPQEKKQLPILRYETHILYLIEKNQVALILGETGSGKSTRDT